MLPVVHSPALPVHARAFRFLSRQTRTSCSAPAWQVARNAARGNAGFALENWFPIAAASSLVVAESERNAAGMLTESRALRTAAK